MITLVADNDIVNELCPHCRNLVVPGEKIYKIQIKKPVAWPINDAERDDKNNWYNYINYYHQTCFLMLSSSVMNAMLKYNTAEDNKKLATGEMDI